MVLTEAPGKDNPESPFQKKKELKDKYFPAGPAMFMRRMGGFNKSQEITRLGAAAILQGAGQKIEDLQKKIDTTLKPTSTIWASAAGRYLV
jgi:hypothetical protein